MKRLIYWQWTKWTSGCLNKRLFSINTQNANSLHELYDIESAVNKKTLKSHSKMTCISNNRVYFIKYYIYHFQLFYYGLLSIFFSIICNGFFSFVRGQLNRDPFSVRFNCTGGRVAFDTWGRGVRHADNCLWKAPRLTREKSENYNNKSTNICYRLFEWVVQIKRQSRDLEEKYRWQIDQYREYQPILQITRKYPSRSLELSALQDRKQPK